MKITRFLLAVLALVAFSCSKDDDAKPSLESKALSLGDKNQVIEAPAALLASDDPKAQQAAFWVEYANSMSIYNSFFKPPTGATKSQSKITASNGRASATGDYVVYVWNDAQSGYSVAYQISEQSDRYVFEIFLKSPKEDWLKYIHAEEKKDNSEGFMKIFDPSEFSDDPSVPFIGFHWTRSGDIFKFTITDYDTSEVIITINTKTKEGSVVFYEENKKIYEIKWDSKGNGTWKWYDENGNIEEEGSWTV